MKTNKIIVLLVLGALLLTGCSRGATTGTPAVERVVPVETVRLSQQAMLNTHLFSGRVLPNKTVAVIPKAVGRVETRQVKVGDVVSAGQVLLTLETKDMQRQVEQARLTLELTKANVAVNEQQSALAKASAERNKALIEQKMQASRESFERNTALYKAGALSSVQYEQTEMMHNEEMAALQTQLDQATFTASEASLRALHAQLDQAEWAYAQALDTLDNAIIRSPSAGVVANLTPQVGEFVTTAQPAAVIAEVNTVKIDIDIAQGLVNHLYPGKAVTLKLPAVSIDILPAAIDSISPTANAAGLYTASIMLPNTDQGIKPGMFAEVTIYTTIAENVYVVDSRAVLERNGAKVVFAAQDGKAVAIPVVTGITSGGLVEIVEGIDADMDIIVRGQQYVVDGGPIRVVGK